MDDNIVRIAVAAVIGLTISISMIAMAVASIARRRRPTELPESTTARLEARLDRMEQAIDAMATEVERVADSQRFTTRLLAERQVEHQS